MNAPIAKLAMSAPLTLAEVVSVDDPDGLNRVEIKLHSFSGPESQEGRLWARVATPFAGPDYGAFFIPAVGDEVLVAFVNGDSRFPVVVGSLWNSSAQAPESFEGTSVDRWVMVGKRGTKVSIDESSDGPRVLLETPNGTSVELSDQGAGSLTCKHQGNKVKLDSAGVSVKSSGVVSIEGATIELKAGMVSVQSGFSDFSGVVNCNLLLTTSVVSASYTPGAGNIW